MRMTPDHSYGRYNIGVQKESLSFEFLTQTFTFFDWKETRERLVSDFIAEGPPVPIPNTEVKLC